MIRTPTQWPEGDASLSEQKLVLLRLAYQMDRLAAESLALWLNKGQDPDGGVYGFLDQGFRPVSDLTQVGRGPSGEVRGDKSLIQQARHLFSYSFYCERRAPNAKVARCAKSAFSLLREKFWQGEGKAMLHQLTAKHRLRTKESQIYAQSFAILALATYARTFSESEAGAMALSLFHLLDDTFHDQNHGGYNQEKDGGWLEQSGAPKGSQKCTNTHIHILECLTALHLLFPEHKKVHARLKEMAQVIATKMRRPSGYVHRHFSLDWTPVGKAVCSYGHDIETSWLLLESLRFLDKVEQAPTRKAAISIAKHALRTGWDEAGGLFDLGTPEEEGAHGGAAALVLGREKLWWVQAEALVGIFRLYQETGHVELLQKLTATFDFLRNHLLDQRHGEFFWGVMSDGSLGPRGSHKGEIWKTPYHGLRALLLTADGIRQSLGRDG